MSGYIEVEGLKEFNRAVRRAVDTDLGKRIGQANKKVGQLVIDRLQPRPSPTAIGVGAGTTVRPSASKREVLLRIGGKHRASASPLMPWGKRRVTGVGQLPRKARPNILGTAEKHQPEIEQAWLDAIAEAMDPAFWKTEP